MKKNITEIHVVSEDIGSDKTTEFIPIGNNVKRVRVVVEYEFS